MSTKISVLLFSFLLLGLFTGPFLPADETEDPVTTYSREEGTKAFSLKGKVPIAEAGLRKEQAQELQNRITEKRLESYVGKEIEVLVEEIIAEEEIALGRGYMNAPEVDGAVILHSGLAADGGVKPGDVVRAKVIKRNNIDLEAVDVRLS